MFGFQRVGDLAWAAGDMRTRGFLIGGTSGRTTLNGEGLQHEDGHSHVLASTVPNCVTYDPTYAYELAVIVQAGLKRMLVDQEDVFYYITTLNEITPIPPCRKGRKRASCAAPISCARSRPTTRAFHVRLLGAGAILREVEAAAEMLAAEHGVSSEVWSVTSFTELRREGLDIERWNMLHPEFDPKVPFITRALSAGKGPVIALDRLYEGARRWHPPLRAGALQGPRHRRFRAVGLSPALAIVLRDRPLPCGGRWPESARRRAIAADAAGAEAIAKYGIDPDGPNPARQLKARDPEFNLLGLGGRRWRRST